MATHRVTSPDGSIYEVNAPEGATDAEVMAHVQAQHQGSDAPAAAPKPVSMTAAQLRTELTTRLQSGASADDMRAFAANVTDPNDPTGKVRTTLGPDLEATVETFKNGYKGPVDFRDTNDHGTGAQIAAAARGGLDALTFNHGDEIMGGLKSLAGGSYQDNVEQERGQRGVDAIASPLARLAGQAAGTIGSALMPMGAVLDSANLMGRIGRGAGLGAAMGGMSEAGAATSNEQVADRLPAGIVEGGLIGAAIPAAGAAGREIFGMARNLVSPNSGANAALRAAGLDAAELTQRAAAISQAQNGRQPSLLEILHPDEAARLTEALSRSRGARTQVLNAANTAQRELGPGIEQRVVTGRTGPLEARTPGEIERATTAQANAEYGAMRDVPVGGIENVNTRGRGQQYHGARGPIGKIDEGYYNPNNIYGGAETFYTTDAADVAAGYGRKNPNAVTYKVDEKAPVKMYDMEAPRSVADWESHFGRLKNDDLLATALESAAAQKGGTPNLREIMDEMRGLSHGMGVSKDEVQDTFSAINYGLEDKGFGGMSHTGGLKTGQDAHNVNIYFRPHEQVDISEMPAGAFRRQVGLNEADRVNLEQKVMPLARNIPPSTRQAILDRLGTNSTTGGDLDIIRRSLGNAAKNPLDGGTAEGVLADFRIMMDGYLPGSRAATANMAAGRAMEEGAIVGDSVAKSGSDYIKSVDSIAALTGPQGRGVAPGARARLIAEGRGNPRQSYALARELEENPGYRDTLARALGDPAEAEALATHATQQKAGIDAMFAAARIPVDKVESNLRDAGGLIDIAVAATLGGGGAFKAGIVNGLLARAHIGAGTADTLATRLLDPAQREAAIRTIQNARVPRPVLNEIIRNSFFKVATTYDKDNTKSKGSVTTSQETPEAPTADAPTPTAKPKNTSGFPDPQGFTAGNITSGLRSTQGNAAVGGKRTSHHLDGDALDYVPAKGQSMSRLEAQLRNYYGGAVRTLNEGTHIHVTLPGFKDAPIIGARGTVGLR